MNLKTLIEKLDDKIQPRNAARKAVRGIRSLRVTGSKPDHHAQTDDSGAPAETAIRASHRVADHETREPTGAALRVTRLAHEAGIRWIDRELADLNTYRRLAVAIASVAVVALTIPTIPGSLLGPHVRLSNIGIASALGFAGFVLSVYVLVRCVVRIHSPLPDEFVQNPKTIIARYLDCPQPAQSEQEVYGGLARDLSEDAESIRTIVRQRWGLIRPLALSAVLTPLTTLIVLLDATQLPAST